MRKEDFNVGSKIVLDDNNNPTVIGAVHKAPVQDDLEKTLQEWLEESKKRRVEHTIATHRDAYGWRLPREKLEQRADLILRYKGIGPIWILKDHKWVRFKRCLDFKSPDIHIRCVDKDDSIHVFNPDAVTIATQDERTRHIAVIRQKQLRKDITGLHTKSVELRKCTLQLEEHAGSLEKEVDRIDRLLKRSDAEEQRRNRKWRQKKHGRFTKSSP